MSPNIFSLKNNLKIDKKDKKYEEIQKKISKYQEYNKK